MKTFKDLVFKPHWLAKEDKRCSDVIQARMTFENGYEISVIKGLPGYNKPLYEIAVFENDKFLMKEFLIKRN